MARDGTLRIRVVGDTGQFERALDKTAGSLGKWGKRAALATGAAVAAGLGASVKAFADFDAAMTKSTAIMGGLSDAMRKDMSDAARQVAKTTTFSAAEAAEAYFFLASAGLDAAQSIDALPKVAKFAQAGAFDMARATDLLTDAQSALGLATDDAQQNLLNMERVSDVLVKANTLANASVEQFSEALTEKAGAALRQLNKDVEEGVAVLSVYADAGVKGSAAGSQLNAVLEGLTRTARLNADAYDALGVGVFDSSGEMRNMADIVGDLEGALEGMTTEQQLAELASLGLTRTARDGIVALLGNADAIREYEEELRNAGGTTEEVANKQLQTFWAQLGLLKDQFVDIGIEIGSKLVPKIMDFVGAVQDNMPVVERILGELWDAFGVLFGGVESSTSESTTHMDSWARNIEKTTGGAVTEIRESSATMRRALETLSRFITGPLTDAFQSMRDWWDKNGPKIKQGANDMRDGVVGALDWIRENWEKVKKAIEIGVAFIVARWAFLAVRSTIHAAVVVASWVATGAASTRAAVVTGASTVKMLAQWTALATRSALAAAGISASAAGLAVGVAASLAAAGVAIHRLIDTMDEAERETGISMDGIVRAFAGLPGAGALHLGLLIRIVRDHWQKLRDGIDELVSWFRELPGRIVAALGNLDSTLLNAGKNLIGGLIKGALEAIKGIGSKIGQALGGAFKQAFGFIPAFGGPQPGEGALPGGSVIGRLSGFMRSTGIPHRVTSTFRPGDPGFHGLRRAVDFAGARPGINTPNLRAIQRAFLPIAPQLKELIGPVAAWNFKNGRRFPYSAGTQRAHQNHVHAAMRMGGIVRQAGRFLVGEDGPEILNLNRGDMVAPLDRADRTRDVTINIYGVDDPLGAAQRTKIALRSL